MIWDLFAHLPSDIFLAYFSDGSISNKHAYFCNQLYGILFSRNRRV